MSCVPPAANLTMMRTGRYGNPPRPFYRFRLRLKNEPSGTPRSRFTSRLVLSGQIVVQLDHAAEHFDLRQGAVRRRSPTSIELKKGESLKVSRPCPSARHL
jgi:hypothetical protein